MYATPCWLKQLKYHAGVNVVIMMMLISTKK